ncbi:phosphatidylserine decarboxylase [Eubacterium ruminantium]|uniref:phosphatidylserine decarboxylase n=1 Tax=Eubacterium ruminantium TaxID=42322 RepID=UPI001567EA8E|nr:phosphatidylserine decarboxylase [Eubacterium ruminantium]
MNTLKFLYTTPLGRCILKPLASKPVSVITGKFLDSRFSRFLVNDFIARHDIDRSEFEKQNFDSFNDCFCRKLKDDARTVESDNNAMIAPCDGLLTVVPIKNGTVLPVKQSYYTVKSLLRDKKLAERYKDGYALVYRLCTNHYHRYCYVESGRKSRNRYIQGVYHTVRPIALENRPVFIENSREYTCIKTDNFGILTQMEVGAMLVGRINNFEKEIRTVRRGKEKGTFLYGGSTIIVLVEKNKVDILNYILDASKYGRETPVLYGQKIGGKHV